MIPHKREGQEKELMREGDSHHAEKQSTCDSRRQASRDEQRKIIKYNHLVANLLAFHTLVTISTALKQLQQDNHAINKENVARLSPYRTGHINRFGNYEINLNRTPDPLDVQMENPIF